LAPSAGLDFATTDAPDGADHFHFETPDHVFRVEGVLRFPDDGTPTLRLRESFETPPSLVALGLPDDLRFRFSPQPVKLGETTVFDRSFQLHSGALVSLHKTITTPATITPQAALAIDLHETIQVPPDPVVPGGSTTALDLAFQLHFNGRVTNVTSSITTTPVVSGGGST